MISDSLICKLLQDGNPVLTKSSSRLRMYDGSVMRPMGVINIKCQVGQTKKLLQFQVVNTSKEPLISAETSLALNLVSLNRNEAKIDREIHNIGTNRQEVSESLLTKREIMKRYGDVFDTLGCLPGELHFQINKDVPPVQHVPRKIPIAMKEQVTKKIEGLIEKKIVAKVNEPTDWISSMVVVKKHDNNKLRICIDPRDLNKALEIPHYQQPTIEDILPKLSKANIFFSIGC